MPTLRPKNEVATPFPVEGPKEAVPSTVEPILKVTVPVAAAGVTLAVNVTFVPDNPAVGEARRVVVVDVNGSAPSMVRLSGDELDAAFPLSPAYSATNDCAPGTNVPRLNVQLSADADNVQVPSV